MDRCSIWLLLAAPLAFLAAACANDPAGGGSTRTRDIEPFDVVSLDPSYGPGTRVDVVGARLATDGTLAVLVDGFSCGVPSRLEIEEGPDAITVDAFAAQYDDGPCPANVVPWYVVAPIAQPLGDRRLQNPDGEAIAVIDCKADPTNVRC